MQGFHVYLLNVVQKSISPQYKIKHLCVFLNFYILDF